MKKYPVVLDFLSGSMKLSIDNKENAYEIFEFLADKSSVEFSLLGVSVVSDLQSDTILRQEARLFGSRWK